MDLLQLGTELIMNKLNLDRDGDGVPDGVAGALAGLLGDENSNLDIAGLVSKMTQGGGSFQDMASSWLGDGDNAPIDFQQIKEIFGSEKISEFASNLGVDEDTAAGTLAEAIPQMVDKGSSGGSLLEAFGGVEGVLGAAKKFFG
jgi:uncharacterized protein YidB (DUF937 family)